jgi:hypothetical protein
MNIIDREIQVDMKFSKRKFSLKWNFKLSHHIISSYGQILLVVMDKNKSIYIEGILSGAQRRCKSEDPSIWGKTTDK